ncbi:MAG TPA: hypothetical protein VGF29_06965 [Hyphomicrobiaceae bacterium]|jgi:hypothetical protein
MRLPGGRYEGRELKPLRCGHPGCRLLATLAIWEDSTSIVGVYCRVHGRAAVRRLNRLNTAVAEPVMVPA